MNGIEINKNHARINLHGSNTVIQEEKLIIQNLELTGDEYKDRLIIQKCIDDNKLKSDILYDGNTVYPFEKTVREFRKLQKSGSLEKLTTSMYHFFIYACGDIAHYDINNYKCYYDNSFTELENRLLKNCSIANWHSDLDRIFKELKIGKYFEERSQININIISLNKLQSIIKECGWNVMKNKDSWKLERNALFIEKFSFDVNISSNKISDIVQEIQMYSDAFDTNQYIESMIEKRGEFSSLTVREIVMTADEIKSMLSTLSSDILYKCRLESQEKNSNLNDIIQNKSQEIDLEMCG